MYRFRVRVDVADVGRLLTIPHISFQAASVPPSPAFIDDRGFAARATIYKII